MPDRDDAARKRGRPPIDPARATVPVSVRLTVDSFDEVARAAARAGCSMSSLIRTRIAQRRDDDRDR